MITIEKCCFCVPRRLGFVMIGCLRLVISILIICLIVAGMAGSGRGPPDSEQTQKTSVMEISIISSLIVDLVLCGVLIAAAIKSHLRLYQVFFRYSVAVAFLTLVGVVVYIIAFDDEAFTIDLNRKVVPFKTIVVSTVIILLLLQLYMILLTRSEIMKIKKTQYWDPRTGNNVLR